jgi:hypothetical protein
MGDQYTIFFFPQLIFFFIPDLGGTMAPAGPPIDPSLDVVIFLLTKNASDLPYSLLLHLFS